MNGFLWQEGEFFWPSHCSMKLQDDESESLLRDFTRVRGETELDVARVVWMGHRPLLEWEVYKTWPRPPSARQLAAARRKALADPRFFLICSMCHRRLNRGQMMHDSDVCQGCAQRHLGVVY